MLGKAREIGAVPKELKYNKVNKDLANYLIDGSLPKQDTYAPEYENLISTWGQLLFNHKDEIMNGTFNPFASRYRGETFSQGVDRNFSIQNYIIKIGIPNDILDARKTLDNYNNSGIEIKINQTIIK